MFRSPKASLKTEIWGRMNEKGPETDEISAPSGAITFGKHLSLAQKSQEEADEKPRRHRSRIVMVFSRTMRDALPLVLSSPIPSLAHKRKSGFEMRWNFNQCGCRRRFCGFATMIFEWFEAERAESLLKPASRCGFWRQRVWWKIWRLSADEFWIKTLKKAVTTTTLVRAAENTFLGSSSLLIDTQSETTRILDLFSNLLTQSRESRKSSTTLAITRQLFQRKMFSTQASACSTVISEVFPSLLLCFFLLCCRQKVPRPLATRH